MAIPRFSFGSGASGLYNPNQILVPTTLTSADRAQADKYQAESDTYNQAIENYRTQVEDYNKALETYNAGPRTSAFNKAVPTKPQDLSFTQSDLDAFEAASLARAQNLQAARQNAVNIIQNPAGFSRQYGIGSLGFEGGGEVPQGGVVDLGAAGFTITPDIFMEYGSGSSKIPTDVDGRQLYLDERWKEGYGQLGFDVETPNRHRFGARASGNYYKGEINFPEELQRFGAPPKETFGTRGIRPEQYSAYYQTPEGTRVSGRYQEGTPERERGFEVMLSKQFGTDDLIKRISRFLEKNRP